MSRGEDALDLLGDAGAPVVAGDERAEVAQHSGQRTQDDGFVRAPATNLPYCEIDVVLESASRNDHPDRPLFVGVGVCSEWLRSNPTLTAW